MAVTDSVVNRNRVVLQSLASVDYGSHTHVTAMCVVTAAVDHLSTSLVDVEAWLKASLVCLNRAKTQLMWLGSQQLLARLDMATMPVLTSIVRIQETARDLDVVIDSRLSLSDHVATVCRSPPSPFLAVPNVTTHQSTASVPTSYYSLWHYNCHWSLKG